MLFCSSASTGGVSAASVISGLLVCCFTYDDESLTICITEPRWLVTTTNNAVIPTAKTRMRAFILTSLTVTGKVRFITPRQHLAAAKRAVRPLACVGQPWNRRSRSHSLRDESFQIPASVPQYVVVLLRLR